MAEALFALAQCLLGAYAPGEFLRQALVRLMQLSGPVRNLRFQQQVQLAQRVFRPFATANVAYRDHAAVAGSRGVPRAGPLEARVELRAIPGNQANFDFERAARTADLTAIEMKAVAVRQGNIMSETTSHQRASLHAQEPGPGEIGFQNRAEPIQSEVAHGCEIVQIHVALARGGKFGLRTAELIILQLQFKLMGSQLVQQALHVFGGDASVPVRQRPRVFLVRRGRDGIPHICRMRNIVALSGLARRRTFLY